MVGMSMTHSMQRRGEESIHNLSRKTSKEKPLGKSRSIKEDKISGFKINWSEKWINFDEDMYRRYNVGASQMAKNSRLPDYYFPRKTLIHGAVQSGRYVDRQAGR